MRGPAHRAAALATAIALFALGCASAPPPPPAAGARPPAAEPAPAAPASTAPAQGGEAKPPTLVVIDPGGKAPQTLAEAAKAERERRRQSTKKPVVVITDKNLAEYAEKGEVTMAHPAEPAPGADATAGTAAPGSPPTPEPAATAGAASAEPAAAGGTDAAPAGDDKASPGPAVADADGPHDEAYWRSRARGVRMRWRQATDEVASLEKKAADFRWRFYAEDDPVVRDQQIKPEWDRVLDDLRRARQDVRAFQGELAELMDEGRRAGALPGWLREGIELEPEPTIEPNPRQPEEPTDSIEPPVIEDTPQ